MIIAGIVLAEGRGKGQAYTEYVEEMASHYRDRDPVSFASRRTMPHFWTPESVEAPEEKALSFAHG